MNSVSPKIYGLEKEGVIRYVGVTRKTLGQRLDKHLSAARSDKRVNHRLNWLRSLESPPKIILLAEATADTQEFAEKYWISLAKDYGCRLVNATDGGDGGENPSPETREKIRQSKLGSRNPNFGKVFSAEYCAKLSAARRGKPRSAETCLKMSQGMRGQKRSAETCQKIGMAKLGNKNCLGRIASEETRAKMRAAWVRRKQKTQD